MDWTIIFAMAIFLTSITGSAMFVIWYVIGKILEKTGFIHVMYELFKTVLAFWFFPLVFLVLVVENELQWGGILFRYTPVIKRNCTAFLLIWLTGMVCFLFDYIRKNRILNKHCHELIPVDGREWDMFIETCKDMHIRPEKLDLVVDYKAKTPYLCGLRRQYVVLPVREYTDRQLRVIYVHELTHYKQNSQLWRHIIAIGKAVYFFNPFIFLLQRQLEFWGEYICDYEAIPQVESMKVYFGEIMNTITGTINDQELLHTQLVRSKPQLLKRVEMMNKTYQIDQHRYRMLPVIVIGIMLVISTIFIHMLTHWMGDRYVDYYFQTVEMVEEPGAAEEDLPDENWAVYEKR